jgi:acyl-CoA synthetase (AMP-forming)/AMP-acid ligase II
VPTALDLRPAGAAPDRPALVDATGTRIDHGTLRAAVDRAMRDLPAGSKALVLVRPRPVAASVVAILAVLAAGHALMLLDPGLPADRFAAFLDRVRPGLVLDDGPLPAPWRPAAPVADLAAWATGVGETAAPHPDLALVLPTSGTTGDPRLVRLSRAALAANVEAVVAATGIRPDDVAAAHLPLAYAFGLSVVLTHLAAGAAVLLPGDGMPAPGFWAALRAAGATTLPGVPFHVETLVRLGGPDRLELPALRTVLQAGGRAAPVALARLHAAMDARGGRLLVMYGQTEAGPRMAVLPHDAFPERPGSVGWALAGGRFAVLGPDGAPLPPGTAGDIAYEGPNVMMGHAEHAGDLARGDTAGGRLATGDLGFLDAAGALTLTGRAGRFAKVAGLRIALDRVEATAAAVAPALAAERDGRLLVAVEGDAAAAAAVRALLATALSLSPAVVETRAVTALPRLASGKPDRRALLTGRDGWI